MHCSRPLTRACGTCGAAVLLRARFCQTCGAAVTPAAAPAPKPSPQPAGLTGLLPTAMVLASRYRIVKKLGQGGMGAVYQAQDTRLAGKLWAIKEMSDAALATPAERQQAVLAFQQEAKMLANLNHPNLPKVVDFFSEGGNEYVVMEFVEGDTLEQRIDQALGPLPETQVLPWADQLCDVLDYLHSRQPPVIFRDLKPANVIVEPGDRIKLIDFGIARHFTPGKKLDTTAFGTAGYAPPEQYGKGQTDARSDIYALGATLHHLLTGRMPSPASFAFPPVRTLSPAVSTATAEAIARAVETDPARRWQTAAAMRTALRRSAQPISIASAAPVPAVSPVKMNSTPALPMAPVPGPSAGVSIPFAGKPSTYLGMPYASAGKRFAAIMIDLVVLFALVVMGAFIDVALDSDAMIFGSLGMMLGLFYFVWTTARSGQTWGKRLMGIKVIRSDGSPPGWGRSIVRYPLGFGIELALLYVLVGFLAWLWPLWDNDRQTWHDKMAKTYVVRK